MADSERTISIIYMLLALLLTTYAVPQVALPFNSQVPTVARVDVPYSFQLSASTFQPVTEDLTYGLLNQPHWLSIDNATRTLIGTPSARDDGTSIFTLTAADDSGVTYMPCTLVVSSEPAPILEADLSAQVAMTANLSSTRPPIITLSPSTVFRFGFSHTSFIDIVQRKLQYYATLSDHTPLPSWINFDADRLVFAGIAPDLVAFPQSWNISLIASDVPGFSGSSASFSITITTDQLAFVPEQQDLFLEAGMHISYTGLQHKLFRNGCDVEIYSLINAKADIPSWLSFNPSTLVIEGVVPNEFRTQNITISVTDRLNYTATATLDIVNRTETVFSQPIGTIAVSPGEILLYHFDDSLFITTDLKLKIDLPESAFWIHFDAPHRNLKGTVPVNVSSSSIQANLIAHTSGRPPQIQPFTIQIKSGANMAPSSSSTLTTGASPTNESTAAPHHASPKESESPKLNSGVIAAIVILSLISTGLLIVCMILCCRQHRWQQHKPERSKSAYEVMPKPSMTRNGNNQVNLTGARTDVERFGEASMPALPRKRLEPPPQIDVDLPLETGSPNPRWRARISRSSRASSLGYGGEDCITADSNIPELGRESRLLQTPHHSFVVADEIARLAKKSSRSSQTKIASQNTQEKRRSQLYNHGDRVSGLQKYQSSKNRRRLRDRRSFGLPAVIACSSLASLSTKAPSVLSAQPSDFPRPPATSSDSSLASLTMSDQRDAARRKTVRIVDAVDCWSDDRPIDVKRQSFIRARASSGQPNPLFAHGSRALSVGPRQTISHTMSARKARQGQGRTTTYSEPSSSEPQPRYMRHISCQAPIAFPHVVSELTLDAVSQSGAPPDTSPSSGYCSTSSSIEEDIIKHLILPKHQRTCVLPGDASPTPPPLSFIQKAYPQSSQENMI